MKITSHQSPNRTIGRGGWKPDKNVNFTFRRKPSVKPDAVMREYLRLKNLAEEM